MTTVKIAKLLLVIVLLVSSFTLIVVNIQDNANVFPAWINDYRFVFLFIWIVFAYFSLVNLF